MFQNQFPVQITKQTNKQKHSMDSKADRPLKSLIMICATATLYTIRKAFKSHLFFDFVNTLAFRTPKWNTPLMLLNWVIRQPHNIEWFWYRKNMIFSIRTKLEETEQNRWTKFYTHIRAMAVTNHYDDFSVIAFLQNI